MTPMQQRVRLSLEDKAKIIVESKKPGFNKKQVEKKYGIGRTTIPNILKNQTQILKKLLRHNPGLFFMFYTTRKLNQSILANPILNFL